MLKKLSDWGVWLDGRQVGTVAAKDRADAYRFGRIIFEDVVGDRRIAVYPESERVTRAKEGGCRGR